MRPRFLLLLSLLVSISAAFISAQASSPALNFTTTNKLISKDTAISIAEECVGARKMKISQPGKITAELKYENYIVTFPHEKIQNGHGADYDAQVIIDAHSGEVTQVLAGE